MMEMMCDVCVCAMQIQLYIQARLTWSGSRLLRHFLQAITMYLTLWVSMSRISDYKHHWSDVLAAAILGTLMSCLTVSHVYRTPPVSFDVYVDGSIGNGFTFLCLSVLFRDGESLEVLCQFEQVWGQRSHGVV